MTTSREWDVVVVGGANTDYVVRGAKLPRAGETAKGDAFQEGPGGKGANQAVTIARLGGRVTMIAKLGSDSRAEPVIKNLLAEKVDVQFVTRDPTAYTGVALVMVDHDGRKQIMADHGANNCLRPSDISAGAHAIKSSKILLSQLEVPTETVAAALRLAKQSGAQVVLDPAPAVPLDDEVLRLIDVIRPNSAEAEVLTGIAVQDQDSARAAAQQLLRRGVGAVAVQAGSEGDLVVWNGGEHWLPKLRVKSVDATGAGDAFAGALSLLLAEGHSLVEAAQFANAAAALATTQLGAQAGLPRREAVLELLSASKN